LLEHTIPSTLPEKYQSFFLQPVSKQFLITGLNYKVWDVVVAEQANLTDVKAMEDAVPAVVIV
jgi:hypothetical protein